MNERLQPFFFRLNKTEDVKDQKKKMKKMRKEMKCILRDIHTPLSNQFHRYLLSWCGISSDRAVNVYFKEGNDLIFLHLCQ